MTRNARSDATRSPTELPPRYDAAAVQEVVAKVWEEERAFHAEPTDPGEPFCIVIPPPNVTGALHLGHALNNTIQDILVRRARMQGKNAVWIPGTDHAGISTQAVVDKRLQAEGKPSLKDYKKLEAAGKNGREQFIALVQAWKDEYEQRILGQLRAMGCSCDFERTAFTMDEQRARGVREAFFRLFKDGLIYRGKRLVNWDPATQTALSDDEVENEEVDGQFYYLRYPLEGTEARRHEGTKGSEPEYVTVATTRPETMLGDTAVAINPKDPRAAGLRGRFVRLPIVNRLVPIIEDEYVVMADPDSEDAKAKYATGFLKVTPAHDPNDWDIGQRHGLAVINVFAPDASISDQHGWPREDFEEGDAAPYLGLDRYEARRAIVAWFRDNNLLEDTKPYRHSVGHSYRSHVPIEPYLSDQWYVAVKKPIPWMPDEGVVAGTDVPKNSLAGLALTALRGSGSLAADPASADAEQRLAAAATGDATLTFVPDRYARTFRHWHENIRDWCISRQLWWGHRIPVFQCAIYDGVGEDSECVPLSEHHALDLPGGASAQNLEAEFSTYIRFRHTRNGREGWMRTTVVGAGLEVESDPDVAQDPDVLDTWFSSALWPMSTLGWPEKTPELAAWNPTDVLCTAREIITLWVSRMVMFNRYLLAHPDEAARQSGAVDPHGGGSGDSRGNVESDGQKRESESVKIESEGLEFKSESVKIKSEGLGFKSKGVNVESDGLGLESGGVNVESDGLGFKTEGVKFAPEGLGFKPESVKFAPEDLENGSDGHGHQLETPDSESLDSRRASADREAGPVPFHTVFIHAMIQDGEGRKMSKSLGNGVDPLDIIDSHGADAMRFTLAQMTTLTQDVRMPVVPDEATGKNTSPKFDNGRNFCNKLWNAGRFVIGGIAGVIGGGAVAPVDEQAWSVVDRWILSRLARTVQSANEAIEEYRFDRYATACYDFFWRDFCDWYVEASKPALRQGGDTAIQTAHVLATCLDVSLRLMHPMIPFATERLWWALCEVMPERGIPGRIMGCASDRLIRAAWPSFDERMDALTSSGAERVVERLQEIVQAIRTIRTENKVDPRKTVPVTIRHGAGVGHHLTANRATIELWATCEITAMGEDVAEPDSASKTTAAGCEIYVSGITDPAAEAGRLARERGDLEKKITTLRGRLENKGYTDKAPAHLVKQTRDELAAAEAELASLS